MKSVLKSLALTVGIPTLVAAVYFGLIASDIYVSEARFAIRSSGTSAPVGGLAALLASPITSGGAQESMVVEDYVESVDMLEKLNQDLELAAHFSSGEIDYLSRFDESSTVEERLEYLRRKVDVRRDTTSDVITLKTKAYSPEMAFAMAQNVIKMSEDLVNTMSKRMETDALETARREVDIASTKVQLASAQLSEFRSDNSSINPAEESSALLGLVSGIEHKLVEVRSELSEKRAYMRESAPAIVSLKNRENALAKQLGIEKARITGGNRDDVGTVGSDSIQMSSLIADFQPLVLKQELAQQQYASALNSLEMARLETTRKKQYLVTFIRPNMPDDAIEPRRMNKTLTVLLFSFLFYAIGGLMWSALCDHIGR